MILPGSLIPSDKYFLKNLTFVVRNPLVWLRQHSSQTLRGQGEEQTTKKQCPSWPTGREVMTTSSCWVRGYNSTPSPTVQSTPVMKANSQKQRCLALRYELLECFALLVMECCYSL